MILLTRFDGSQLVVNAELIEFIEATPDTIVSMTTGRKVVVRESLDVIIQATLDYKRLILRGPQVVQEN